RAHPSLRSFPTRRSSDLNAIAVAEPHMGGQPFAVLLGDDIMAENNPLLVEMLKVHERYGRSVVAVMEVPRSDIHLYGSIQPEFVDRKSTRLNSSHEWISY